ncbi:Rv3235 family protein [Gordonia sp. ABSL1-1]|uniref:Rv3235 family protein n=1 Tax=Gordonia sp. ABSL1-1 TaxID=3053923 RepID=UPI002572DC39|nr:Rv3235 family protein [Gordonia sp. ABSL1-1]MDL9936729.1 Rv3235 family protein [Gordonia sp. ABSL1-1]
MEITKVRVRPAPPYEHPAGMRVPVPLAASVRGPDAARRVPETPRGPTSPGPGRSSTAGAARDAHCFAIGACRVLFEVVEGRRGIGQLTGTASAAVVDQVAGLVRHNAFRGSGLSVTTLRRVHVQLCDATAAEVFGSYTTGERVRAFAARIECLPRRVRVDEGCRSGRAGAAGWPRPPVLGRVEYRWQLVEVTLA